MCFRRASVDAVRVAGFASNVICVKQGIQTFVFRHKRHTDPLSKSFESLLHDTAVPFLS